MSTETRAPKVYVVQLGIHIVADDAKEADRWFDHYFDRGDGPITIRLDGSEDEIPVFYANYEGTAVEESDYSYAVEWESGAPVDEKYRLPAETILRERTLDFLESALRMHGGDYAKAAKDLAARLTREADDATPAEEVTQ